MSLLIFILFIGIFNKCSNGYSDPVNDIPIEQKSAGEKSSCSDSEKCSPNNGKIEDAHSPSNRVVYCPNKHIGDENDLTCPLNRTISIEKEILNQYKPLDVVYISNETRPYKILSLNDARRCFHLECDCGADCCNSKNIFDEDLSIYPLNQTISIKNEIFNLYKLLKVASNQTSYEILSPDHVLGCMCCPCTQICCPNNFCCLPNKCLSIGNGCQA